MFESEQAHKSDDSEGRGKKIIVPSNIIDNYTRLQLLLGLKRFGHTDTLTEASNLTDELYKRSEIQNEQQNRNALVKFHKKMELPSKILEQIAFNTRRKTEEHMLFVLRKPTHEQYFSQPLQTNNKQFKTAATFLSCYSGIFNAINKNNFSFTVLTNDDNFNQTFIPPGAYETELRQRT